MDDATIFLCLSFRHLGFSALNPEAAKSGKSRSRIAAFSHRIRPVFG